ncbi:MAG: putative transcriptional regulator [Rickettsiales bacterium]
MDNKIAVNLLSLLGSDIRLSIFRMLIKAGKCGLKPTYISKKIDINPSKLSFHLSGLKKSGLINFTKEGRELTYFANYQTINQLVEFLFENCCEGDKEDCLSSDLCK